MPFRLNANFANFKVREESKSHSPQTLLIYLFEGLYPSQLHLPLPFIAL